jgi:CheY-like chemotaxis protein
MKLNKMMNQEGVFVAKTVIVKDGLTSRTLLLIVHSRFKECHIDVSGEGTVEAFRKALADAAHYELIGMNIRMPGMDGIKAIRQSWFSLVCQRPCIHGVIAGGSYVPPGISSRYCGIP